MEPAATDSVAAEPLDIAATFPSWDPASPALAERTAFVADVCDPASPNYRVLDDPTYEADPNDVAICEEIKTYANRGTKNSDLSPERHRMTASTFEGMKPEDLRVWINSFLDTVPVVGFDGMTYGGSFYKPMIEVINYLKANDFDVYMVSAGEREYGDMAYAQEGYDLVAKEQWTAFSMAEDWATIYGENVVKTELPGAEAEELADAA